jgi:hypothetical protein
MSTRLILNLLIFQVGWLTAVVGAARGFPLAGVVYAVLWGLIHHWHLTGGRMNELALVLGSAVTGFLVDSALVLAGVIGFPEHARLGSPTAVWMVCLWVMFAMTLRHSLGWLRGRYVLAAVLGGAFGPLAYWAGSRIGAIELADAGDALIPLVAAWSASMIALLRLEAATRAAGTPGGRHEGTVST